MRPEFDVVLESMRRAADADDDRAIERMIPELLNLCVQPLRDAFFPMPTVMIPFVIYTLEVTLAAVKQLDPEATAAVEDLRRNYSMMVISANLTNKGKE